MIVPKIDGPRRGPNGTGQYVTVSRELYGRSESSPRVFDQVLEQSRRFGPMTTAEESRGDDQTSTTTGLSALRKALIGTLLVIITAAGVLLLTLDSGGSGEQLPDDELTEFHLIEVTALNGDTASFAQFAGKPVILNFFASWCAPCRAEMPTLEGLHRILSDELSVVGLAIDGERPAREIVGETGVTYFIGLDEGGALLDRFDGFGMPTTVFIGANGEILDSHIGALTDEAFRHRITDLFGIGDI